MSYVDGHRQDIGKRARLALLSFFTEVCYNICKQIAQNGLQRMT